MPARSRASRHGARRSRQVRLARHHERAGNLRTHLELRDAFHRSSQLGLSSLDVRFRFSAAPGSRSMQSILIRVELLEPARELVALGEQRRVVEHRKQLARFHRVAVAHRQRSDEAVGLGTHVRLLRQPHDAGARRVRTEAARTHRTNSAPVASTTRDSGARARARDPARRWRAPGATTSPAAAATCR